MRTWNPTRANRIRGVLYGQAVGDALGIPVEYKTKEQVLNYAERRPTWPREFQESKRQKESFDLGEWSDDTDQALLILESYFESGERVEPLDFAVRLKEWAFVQKGMGGHTRKVLFDPDFLRDPVTTSRRLAEGGHAASNGALMRTSVVGLIRPDDLEWTAQAARTYAEVTHADPRCVASAVALAVAVAQLVGGGEASMTTREAVRFSAPFDSDVSGVIEMDRRTTIYDLNLDEGLAERAPRVGFTYKTLGAAFWALQLSKTLAVLRPVPEDLFCKPLFEVLSAGGDADTNGAVVGALLGAHLGIERIPERYTKKLKNPDRITRVLEKLIPKES